MTKPIITVYILLLWSLNSYSQDLSESLRYAFKKSDKDSLRSILTDWNRKVKSNQGSVEDVYEQAVYSIFNEFYSPFHLDRIGSSEWGDSIYFNKMAIVQNEISYAIAEFPDPDTIMLALKKETISLAAYEKKFGTGRREYRFFRDLKYPKVEEEDQKEITDFRPQTKLPPERKLYLTSPYERELTEFLSDQHTPLGAGGIMNPARATRKTFRRQAFLNNYLALIYGHWGGYWHLETHPEVSLVILNPSMTKAVIYFRLIYEGGEAYLEKQKGQWTLIESKLIWIE